MLAEMLAKHPCELRADFQRVYGLDLGGMGEDYTYAHAADLAAMLPEGSCVFAAEHPELQWTMRDWMVWSIEYSLRVLRWQNTENGRKGTDCPKPLPTPMDGARIRDGVLGTDMDLIAEQLGITDRLEGGE